MSVSADPRIGTEVLGYRVEALLGRGGMSAVYRAEDPRLKRRVALKLLTPDLAVDERFRERFLRESELAASIEHPHIVPIYDAGEVDGSLYIAMRYVEGTDLKSLLRREGALEPARALALVGQVADALDAAHERGLVHRDVKPSNVLVTTQAGKEHCYLSDFGLTKSASDRSGLTATGQIVGTVDYVAPELIEGKPVDARADVYSLGCLLYECLTSEVPFARDSELAVLYAHVQEPPPRPSARQPELPKELDAVLGKALAKNPAQRHATCTELVEAARAALPAPAPAPTPRRRLALVLAVLPAIAGALAAALTLTLGGDGTSTKPTLTPKADSLQRIDPKTNKLVATIEVGSSPSDVAVGEGAVWVTNAADRTVTRIDPSTNATTTSAAGSDPRRVAAGEGSVWVQHPRDDVLSRLDPRTLATLAITEAGRGARTIAVGAGAVWLAGSYGVARMNRNGTIVATIDDPYGPDWLAVGEGAVWAAHAAFPSIWRFDPATNRVVAKIELPFTPWGLAAGEGGVWVADPLRDEVVEIDPATNRIARRIRVGDNPLEVAVGEGALWVANFADGTVSRIDPGRGKVVATIRVGPTPENIAAGLGGVWVTVHPP